MLRYLALRVSLWPLSLLPLRWAQGLGGWLGGLAFLVPSTDRQRTLDSLRRAFPERSEAERRALGRACFAHLGRAALELSSARRLDRTLEGLVRWAGPERAVLEGALGRGRGVLFVTGHVGHWELLARRVARAGLPCRTIAKETTDPRLTRLIERLRGQAGLRTIWRGRPGAARAMLSTLRAGEILGMLIDQDTRVQSVFVPFFGELAATPRAAADLALRTGAAVVVGFCPREPDGGYRIRMKELEVSPSDDPEEDVRRLTAAMTSEIEAAIRAAPEQWVWMHRRWRTRP